MMKTQKKYSKTRGEKKNVFESPLYSASLFLSLCDFELGALFLGHSSFLNDKINKTCKMFVIRGYFYFL